MKGRRTIPPLAKYLVGILICVVVVLLIGNKRQPTSALLSALRANSTIEDSTHKYWPSAKQTMEGEILLVPLSVNEIEAIADGFCTGPEWTKSSFSFLSYNAKEPNRIDFIAVSPNTDNNASPSQKTRINIQYRRTLIDKAIDWIHGKLVP